MRERIYDMNDKQGWIGGTDMKEHQKKANRCGKAIWFAVGSVLTIVGFVVIPPVLKKYGNKAYKKSLDVEDIDFDRMGPEIVPFEDDSKEEE